MHSFSNLSVGPAVWPVFCVIDSTHILQGRFGEPLYARSFGTESSPLNATNEVAASLVNETLVRSDARLSVELILASSALCALSLTVLVAPILAW